MTTRVTNLERAMVSGATSRDRESSNRQLPDSFLQDISYRMSRKRDPAKRRLLTIRVGQQFCLLCAYLLTGAVASFREENMILSILFIFDPLILAHCHFQNRKNIGKNLQVINLNRQIIFPSIIFVTFKNSSSANFLTTKKQDIKM